jgi:hypothetical protein
MMMMTRGEMPDGGGALNARFEARGTAAPRSSARGSSSGQRARRERGWRHRVSIWAQMKALQAANVVEHDVVRWWGSRRV